MKSKADRFGVPLSTQGLVLASTTSPYPRLEEIIGRKLTETEESAAESMGSEHASYGSSKFYLQTILPVNGVNHVAAIGDEAAAAVIGVIDGETIVAAYSSESHNSPSFVCAHPGAATGTGGNERDNIALTATRVDSLFEARRQGHPLFNEHNDPLLQHTDETTKGIADYGNAMGIPHGDGSIKYDPRYAGNNLVNVACVSIAPASRLVSNQVPTINSPDKYVAIYVGKASDTTGVGGTKFASQAIDMGNQDLNEKAVQDPDPHLQEAVTRGIERLIDVAKEEKWDHQLSLKDMGAAGLLCSTIEQLHDDIGVILYGDLVPQQGERTSLELLEAETQERFFIYVHEDFAERVLDIFNTEIGLPHVNKGAQAKVIGRCNNSGNYTFVRNGIIDVDLPAEDLKAGPLLFNPVKEPTASKQKIIIEPQTTADHILAVLNSINFKSDAYVHNHYDKHIRSTNIVNRGEGAATLRTHPLLEGKIGYSFAFDSNSVYGLLDPKRQAEDSFIRGACKMATMGASVIGVTNNANYGRTNVPEEMWAFVKGQEGIAKACYAWELEAEYVDMIAEDEALQQKLEKDTRRHVTVNSGNCSLNKANANTGTAIPPTTILGLLGWSPSPHNYATWDLKQEESTLFLIGARQNSLDGTDYLQVTQGIDTIGTTLFTHDYDTLQKEVSGLITAIRKGLVSAANVIEEGGLVNAVSEMVANTSLDVVVDISNKAVMGEEPISETGNLFSESYGMVVQVNKQQEGAFLETLESKGVRYYEIGTVAPARLGLGSLSFIGKHYAQLSQHQITLLYHNKLETMLRGVV